MRKHSFLRTLYAFLIFFILSYQVILAIAETDYKYDAIGLSSPAITTSKDLLDILYEQTDLHNIDDLASAGYLSAAEARVLKKEDSVLNYATVWRILLPAFGIFPYPADCYNIPQYPYAPPLAENYANARVAAILCGFTTENQRPDNLMPLGDLEKLVIDLKSGQAVLPTPNCDSSYILNIETAAAAMGVPAWDVKTYRGRNSFINSYKLIPQEWMVELESCGWGIKFQLPEDYQPINSLPGGIVMGVTHYEYQTIYICDTPRRVTLHEFTHFVAARVGWDDEFLDTVFKDEASAMQATLGDYSQLSASEYLADFVAYWLLHPEMHNFLYISAPQSAVLAQELTEGYAELRATAG